MLHYSALHHATCVAFLLALLRLRLHWRETGWEMMSEKVDVWAQDDSEMVPPAGEEVEQWVRESLEGNRFSRQGVLLRHAPLPIAPHHDDHGNQRDTRWYIHHLVRSTGIAYREKSIEGDGAATPITVAVTNVQEEATTETAGSPLTITSSENARDVRAPEAAPPSVDAPCPPCPVGSGLAQLIYEAKTRHGPHPQVHPAASRQHETTETREPMTHKRSRVASSVLPPSSSSSSDDEEGFGVVLPEVASVETAGLVVAAESDVAPAKHPSQMTREEFLRQFKRAPRRGEIGQSAEEIARAEQLGYVMSGSRSKAAQLYIDRVQRQLHEREAAKLQRQFRKVEDERMDASLIAHLAQIVNAQKM